MKKLLTLLITLLLIAPNLWAEPLPASVAQVENLLAESEVGKTRLLVLQFGATGMTESAARSYSNLIAQNLANTKRFEVFDADQSEKEVMNEAPHLLPCFEIGCGMQMAQIMAADRVLSGHITLTESGLIRLSVKMVNAKDNNLEFEDSIRFTDETMDQRFYLLARRIGSNTPLKGLVLEANNKIAVISLGGNQGIQVGDRLVIYRNLSVQTEGIGSMPVDRTRRNNIGLLTITKVGGNSSEGVYFQTIEVPKTGQFVLTYLEKSKQIELIDSVRKELDTHLRNVYEIEEKVTITPVRIEDVDKKKWILAVRGAESEVAEWATWMAGGGAATGVFLYQYNTGDDMKVIAGIGVLVYSVMEYFSATNRLKDLVEQGKFKGYLDYNFDPDRHEASLGVNFRF